MSKYDNRVVVISGPTGCGESTLTNMVCEKYPRYKRLITATSRAIRSGEKDGVDYYYLTKEEFKKQIDEGNMLEYTHIKNRDDYYGSQKSEFEGKLNAGFNIIANTDAVGTKFYKDNYDALTIFIEPDSIDNLRKRLKERNPEISDELLDKRTENAIAEIKNEKDFYQFSVVNKQGKINEALDSIIKILKDNGYKLDNGTESN